MCRAWGSALICWPVGLNHETQEILNEGQPQPILMDDQSAMLEKSWETGQVEQGEAGEELNDAFVFAVRDMMGTS